MGTNKASGALDPRFNASCGVLDAIEEAPALNVGQLGPNGADSEGEVFIRNVTEVELFFVIAGEEFLEVFDVTEGEFINEVFDVTAGEFFVVFNIATEELRGSAKGGIELASDGKASFGEFLELAQCALELEFAAFKLIVVYIAAEELGGSAKGWVELASNGKAGFGEFLELAQCALELEFAAFKLIVVYIAAEELGSSANGWVELASDGKADFGEFLKLAQCAFELEFATVKLVERIDIIAGGMSKVFIGEIAKFESVVAWDGDGNGDVEEGEEGNEDGEKARHGG